MCYGRSNVTIKNDDYFLNRMDQVIQGLRANKEKAQEIINKANENHDKLIAAIPDEAKERIKGLKEQNQEALRSLEKSLKADNEEKEKELKEETAKVINRLHQQQESHLKEIADILYQKVITV